MTATSLLAFAGLCLMLALMPGPDTFLVLRTSVKRTRAGLASAAGSGTGALVWAALVGLGLAAIVEQSAEIFRWIKIVGGLYLLYLGISSYVKARKVAKAGLASDNEGESPVQYSTKAAYGAGVLSAMLNPKLGLFYLAVVPQFIPHGGNTLGMAMILGLTMSFIGTLYMVILAVVANRAVKWLKKPKVGTVIDRASSGILAVLGVGVIATS